MTQQNKVGIQKLGPLYRQWQESSRVLTSRRFRLKAGFLAFLEKYGYLKPGPREELTSTQVKEAVREFQWISHLPVSGTLDEPTIRQMAEPRCGVKDVGSHSAWEGHVETLFLGRASKPRRVKRFLQQGEKWFKHRLTYKIINWPRYLEPSRVKVAVRTAFELWSNVSPLTFWEVTDGPADIRLAFYQGEHNDGIGNAFDGPGADCCLI
ncbi:matrix metalloproteinase-28-like, partial [Mustelus asterias]